MGAISLGTSFPSIALTAGLVVLSFSAIRKIKANLTIRSGTTELLGLSISDWTVIVAEAIVVGVGVKLTLPWSNAFVGLYFAALFVVAFILRGTQCNCFGISDNTIDSLHLALLSVIAVTNLVSVLSASAKHSFNSVFLGLLLGVIILTVWQRRRTSKNDTIRSYPAYDPAVKSGNVLGITIFTQQGCNSCRVLRGILNDQELFTPLTFEDEKNSSLVREFKISSFPAALVYISGRSGLVDTRQLNGITEIIGFLANGARRSGS